MSSAPIGDVSVKLPGWVVVYARAASILTLLFALAGVMLMISGAPQTPFSWPTFWEAVALMVIASSVFVWSTAPMEALATEATSQDVASAQPHTNTFSQHEEVYDSDAHATEAAQPAQGEAPVGATLDRQRATSGGAGHRSASTAISSRPARPRP